MFETPILFLIFNRPDTTSRVFEQIRKVKPAYLYVAADGPRPDRVEEKKLCIVTRDIVLNNIDWECEVKTLIREENLGCGIAPSQAITWFFDQVPAGIILEDDCLPDESFFGFCRELLIRYAFDERIYMIAGTNVLKQINRSDTSYIFSQHAGIWGWATWKRAWEKYDYKMASWDNEANQQIVRQFFTKENELEFFTKQFEQTYQGLNVSWWDYQWYYTRIKENGIGIVPSKNLISNIGFGCKATHTFDTSSNLAALQTFNIGENLKHPGKIEVDRDYENSLINPPKIQRSKFKSFFKKLLCLRLWGNSSISEV